jgi:LytS/YehU family sensor histidine kinase
MDQRRLLGLSACVFAALGVLAAGLHMTVMDHSLRTSIALVIVYVAIEMFWVPVTALIARSTRISASRSQFVALYALALLVVASLEPLWRMAMLQSAGWGGLTYATAFSITLASNLLCFVAIVGFAWLAESSERRRAMLLSAARIEKQIADEQLHVLTLQLQPHFLFNTLNLIAELPFSDSTAAQHTLANLRALLTQSLEHAFHSEVPLREELRFVQAYAEIQGQRFGSRLEVTIAAAPDVLDAQVPHLLLQPLVENAIVHGIAPKPQGGRVRLSASRVGAALVVRVVDDGVGFDAPTRVDGIGLTNSRRRLHRLYGADQSLALTVSPTGETMTVVTLPYRETPATALATSHAEEIEEPVHDGDLGKSPRNTPLRTSLQLALVWIALGATWAEWESARFLSMGGPNHWTAAIQAGFLNASLWLLICPAILALSYGVGATRSIARRAVLQIPFALLAAALHGALWVITIRQLIPELYAESRESAMTRAVSDILLYFAIFAFIVIYRMRADRRDAALAMTQSRAALARAKVASIRLHLQPMVLLAALDAIAQTIREDPDRAEHALARMGDLLRMILAEFHTETVTLDDEISLLSAFVDITSSGDRSARRQSVAVRAAHSLREQARLEPMTLAPMSMALGGQVDTLDARVDDGALVIVLGGPAAAIDQARLSIVNTHLSATYGDGIGVRVEPSKVDGQASVSLRIPLLREDTWRADDEEVALAGATASTGITI